MSYYKASTPSMKKKRTSVAKKAASKHPVTRVAKATKRKTKK